LNISSRIRYKGIPKYINIYKYQEGTNMSYQNLENNIKSIVNRSITELHDQLYPKSLGKAAEMRTPEMRLIVIAKFEGRVEVLKELGANTKELEKKIDEEIHKVHQYK
jgi:hypothetical protein